MKRFALLLMTNVALAAEPLDWKGLPLLPDRLGVAGAFAGVTAGGLLVAGGANFPERMPWEGGRKVWRDAVWWLDRPDGKWKTIGRLPRALGYGVSATTEEGVVVAGGSDVDRHYAEVTRYRWTDGRLVAEPLPPLPVPLAGAAGALVGTILYVAGGSTEPGEQVASARVLALDFAALSKGWQEVPRCPGPARVLAVAGAAEGKFYLFGGAALEPDANGKIVRRYLRDAWSYHPQEGWQALPDLPHACVAAPSPAPLIGGRLWLFAGDDGSLVGKVKPEEHPGFPARAQSYDVEQKQWREEGEIPAPRATAPVVAWEKGWVIPSGEVRPGVRSAEVWMIIPR